MGKNQDAGPESFRCGVPITVAKLIHMLEVEPAGSTIDVIPGRSPSLVVRGPLETQPELAEGARSTVTLDTEDATK